MFEDSNSSLKIGNQHNGIRCAISFDENLPQFILYGKKLFNTSNGFYISDINTTGVCGFVGCMLSCMLNLILYLQLRFSRKTEICWCWIHIKNRRTSTRNSTARYSMDDAFNKIKSKFKSTLAPLLHKCQKVSNRTCHQDVVHYKFRSKPCFNRNAENFRIYFIILHLIRLFS